MSGATRLLLPPVLRMLAAAGYQDAFHAVGNGSGRTFPSHSPLVRIDFLFPALRWSSWVAFLARLGGDVMHQASDHRPLIVEWAWPQGEALPA